MVAFFQEKSLGDLRGGHNLQAHVLPGQGASLASLASLDQFVSTVFNSQ